MTSSALVRTLFAVTLLALAGAAPVAAQTMLAPSPALACLSRTDGLDTAPTYPEQELSRKEGGTVRVQLEFKGPDTAPKLTIVKRPSMGNFDSTVSAHVKKFRVPCMRPGDAAVMLTQDYVFDADQQARVVAAPPRDNADPARAALLKCMAHVDGEAKPVFPREALQRREEGSLIVRLHFSSPALPPEVTPLNNLPSRALRRAVADYVAGMRVPCLQDRPLDTLIAYKYFYENGDRTLLRDSTLIETLAAARDLKTPAQFDFTTMQCPFDLRITYSRPFAPNTVQQLDSAVAAREPFMAWLRGLTLKLPDNTAANVFGNKFVVTVPCTKLDL